MTPNVSILLQRWGVDKIIGNNLVQFEELNMRRKDGTRVGYTKIATLENSLNRPWWVVHRAHLHEGLIAVAESLGAKILTNSAVTSFQYDGLSVDVETSHGKKYTFHLVIGADGLNSVTRRTLFPEVVPEPPTNNCAFRALVPYSQIRKDPLARELVEKKTMEVWMAEESYVITYPISDGTLFNLVMSHHLPEKLYATQPNVPIEEMRDIYKEFDPRLRRIIDMIPQTVSPHFFQVWVEDKVERIWLTTFISQSRWPLMVTGPLASWSSPKRNIVLMGDAAHSMVNHMAQGAATAMEDGAFLGKCIGKVVEGKIKLNEAVEIYEQERMPKAYQKQQVSFLNGAIWHLADGPGQRARDEAMRAELEGKYYVRSSNLYGDPQTVLDVYGYDAEAHAEKALHKYLNQGREASDPDTKITSAMLEKYMGWFMDKPTSAAFEAQPAEARL